MSLKVSKGEGVDFELIPEGLYIGRCFRIIDLGTQEVIYKGETKHQAKVLISWEILDSETKMQDGRVFAATKKYTASLNDKSQLYKDLVSWRGKKFTEEELEEFDLKNILGKYCQLQVIHSEGETKYANVNTVLPYKGERPKAINEEVVFDITEPDKKVFENLSDKLKGQIMMAPEWKDRTNSASVAATSDVVIQDLDPADEINLDEIAF